MEATLREMGVRYHPLPDDPRRRGAATFSTHFSEEEWARITAGIGQRLKAFEYFLRDVHGRRQILRDGVVPVHAVLGSAHYLNPSVGLPRPQGAYLHLCGINLCRRPMAPSRCGIINSAGQQAFRT